MRLWHKDLIPVLPSQQLLGQWGECCLIARNIAEKGTPGSTFVNKIMDYPIEHFFLYGHKIYMEMRNRGYKVNFKAFEQFGKWFGHLNYKYDIFTEIFKDWHNTRYLKQCLYNLEEKYDCGVISDKEWEIITSKYYGLII